MFKAAYQCIQLLMKNAITISVVGSTFIVLLASTSVNAAAISTITPASLDDVERQHIRQLMDRYEGNRKKVAEALGVSERTIYRKLRRLGIT